MRPMTVAARASVRTVCLAAALALPLASCRHAAPGEFIWAEDARPTPGRADAGYAIQRGDVLSVRVWDQDAISTTRARVRTDGRISLPLIQDVEVVGSTPDGAAREVAAKLRSFVAKPIVTVTVEETSPLRVTVVGEVARPGRYDLEAGAVVLDALAAAGGFTAFASSDGIYVLRSGYFTDGRQERARIRFRYDALSRGGRAAAFLLSPGDIVVFE
jgi:polysaccharide biosynthesis/export protein